MRKNLPQIIACIFAALVVGAQIAWSQDATVTIEPPRATLEAVGATPAGLQETLKDIGTALACAALVAGVTLFKQSAYFKNLSMPKRLLFEVGAMAVQHIYRNFSKPLKDAQGGKLTPDQKVQAREMATEYVIENAPKMGYEGPLEPELVEPMVQEVFRQTKIDAIAIDNHKRVRKGRHVGIGS